ncbi:hypothetical protein [Streptomyces halstedii]
MVEAPGEQTAKLVQSARTASAEQLCRHAPRRRPAAASATT